MKRNKKLKNTFFRPFRVLHIIGKQAYKLELFTKCKIHHLFYVSLLEKNTIRKRQVNNPLLESEKELKLEAKDNKEYEVKAIIDSAVYSEQTNNSNQMPGLYYLVS